jgi:inhibitor of KinA
MFEPIIAPFGEAAVLLTVGTAIDRDVSRHVHGIVRTLERLSTDGITDVVPAYTTCAVYFDPDRTTRDAVTALVAQAIAAPDMAETVGRHVVIPVRYDGEDLEDVARATGLSVGEVIARHSAVHYYAYALGFTPGFAYLGELDASLVLPRRSTPRVRVPAGSVAIAGAQTAVYPSSTPGGWHLLGTTTLVMFDPQRDPPALIQPGDVVRFEVIQ